MQAGLVIPKAALHGGDSIESPPTFVVRYGWINGGDLAGVILGGKGFAGRSTTRPLKPQANKVNGVYKLFYQTLEQDILKNGFRNPILTWGYEDGIWVIYGTTRAWFAEKHSLSVPTFIVDFTPLKWTEYPQVETKEEALSHFTDPPYIFKWEPNKYFNFCNERYALDPMERKRQDKPQDRLLNNETFEF